MAALEVWVGWNVPERARPIGSEHVLGSDELSQGFKANPPFYQTAYAKLKRIFLTAGVHPPAAIATIRTLQRKDSRNFKKSSPLSRMLTLRRFTEFPPVLPDE
jgi:hypothetical protein